MPPRPRLLLFLPLAAQALGPPPGTASDPAGGPRPQASPSGYVKYWHGQLPIVILAPHGGTAKPADIPDRTRGVLTRDGYSAELAAAIHAALQRRLGREPHLVVCELARTKVDCNRKLDEGAQGNARAEQVWREFHAFIETARDSVLQRFRHGICLDVHSHGHPGRRIELGYLLRKSELQLPDDQLNADPGLADRSSIRRLDKISPASFSELVRGPTSLGGLLEARGIPAVPAPGATLARDDAYFNGAYNIAVHGSRDQDQLDAVQLEFHLGARNTPERRAATAAAIAESLDIYFERHYGTTLPRANTAESKP